MRRLFAYLLFTRGLDKDVVQEFVKQKMLYESKNYHNAVFLGYDQSGIAQHAHERGTITGKPFKHNIPSSKPEYSFHWNGTSSHLFFFSAGDTLQLHQKQTLSDTNPQVILSKCLDVFLYHPTKFRFF